MSIELRHISKSFGGVTALRDIDLTIPDHGLVALLGPSGCGKTTLLRIIAGLETPDPRPEAVLRVHDADLAGRAVCERGVGFVFQHYALFRHMSVFDNIAFGLTVRPRATRPGRAEIRDRVGRLLRLIQMEGFEKRYPRQLSGGQRQRVALARALAVEPRVLLLDEPFGALDARVRQELRQWLRRLHDEINLTSVLVTHDQEEALEVADRVVVLNRGRIEQEGTPDEIFHQPANEFVMRFIGQVNLFHARRDAAEAGEFYVRPHELAIQRAAPAEPALTARVERILSAAPQARVELSGPDGGQLCVELSHEQLRELDLKPGERVCVSPKRFRSFDRAESPAAGTPAANDAEFSHASA